MNVTDIFAIIGGVVTIASVIVKLTPSQKDDTVLDFIIKILDVFSVFNPNGTRTDKVKTDD